MGNTKMNVREVIKIIEDDGWFKERQKGSHAIYKHHTKAGIVVISIHKMSADVPKGTLSGIIKQAGLKI